MGIKQKTYSNREAIARVELAFPGAAAPAVLLWFAIGSNIFNPALALPLEFQETTPELELNEGWAKRSPLEELGCTAGGGAGWGIRGRVRLQGYRLAAKVVAAAAASLEARTRGE